MPDRHSAQLASFLCAALRAHDVDAQIDGDSVHLVGTDMSLCAAIVGTREYAASLSVQLDVVFEIGPGRAIVESCIGVGASLAAAIDNAIQAFTANSLHVMLAAFARAACDQVTEERWRIGGHSYRAILGNVTGRGNPPGGVPPSDWFSDVEAAVRTASLTARTHWLRVYCARHPDGEHVTEVLLDNEEWPMLAARLNAFSWPASVRFYSARMFMIFDGGFDTSRAIAALHRLADRPDDEIEDALVAQGADRARAEALVRFVPTAFGRRLLAPLGVRASDEAVRVDGSGERTFDLRAEPVFLDAAELARAAFEDGTIGREIVQSVARRSTEVDAVNQALESGLKVSGLVLDPSRFFFGT